MSTKGGSSQKNTYNAKAAAKYRHLFADPMYVYVLGDALTDDIAGIDHRLTVGPGLGTLLLKDAVSELSAGRWLRLREGKTDRRLTAADGTVSEVSTEDDRRRRPARGPGLQARPERHRQRLLRCYRMAPTIDDFRPVPAQRRDRGRVDDERPPLPARGRAGDSFNSEPAEGKEDNDLSLIAGVGYKPDSAPRIRPASPFPGRPFCARPAGVRPGCLLRELRAL
ncbi:MAG: DUF481 domain-containing protein [Kiritimatiellia bacterium]